MHLLYNTAKSHIDEIVNQLEDDTITKIVVINSQGEELFSSAIDDIEIEIPVDSTTNKTLWDLNPTKRMLIIGAGIMLISFILGFSITI